eukprot:220945-Chlamydomonas_euryale.AAC.1
MRVAALYQEAVGQLRASHRHAAGADAARAHAAAAAADAAALSDGTGNDGDGDGDVSGGGTGPRVHLVELARLHASALLHVAPDLDALAAACSSAAA